MNNANGIDTRINALRPGQRIELSSGNDRRVVAERSGNGKAGRVVRESRDGFTVIRSWTWGET